MWNMLARGPAVIRNINRYEVLQTIRLHENQISRSELSEVTGLSQATISSIVGHLVTEGALIEEDSEKNGARGRGRPLVQLRLNPAYMHVVGIKIAFHQVAVSLTDFTGHVCASENIPCESVALTTSKLANLISKSIRTCLKKTDCTLENVSGIGVGIPGFVGTDSGIVYWSAVIKERNVPFAKILQDKFGVPVFVENDANLVTLAENWFGLAKGLQHAAVITIEHGTGSGLILNGRLFRGALGLGAEIGHTKLVFDGPICQCGQRGCMETHTGGFAVLREAEKAGLKFPEHPMDFHAQINLLNDISAKADAGDKKLGKVFQQMGRYLGLGISNLMNLLNPQRIIVCEGAFRCTHLLEEPIRATIEEMVLPPLRDKLDLVFHRWGDEVWARGAAGLVLEELDQKL
jgi:predicted NBD/HSP70 family sugar kinase